MKGQVDRSDRALVTIQIRPSLSAVKLPLVVWIDTAFTGELVIPRSTIESLALPQSSAIRVGLADGTQVLLETFSCHVNWFGEERVVEVVESNVQIPLLGMGLLRNRKLEIDYRLRTLTLD